MNRTLQDEFIMYYKDYELEDIHEFNEKMLQYMLWYNTERLHHSLNKKPPLQCFCDIMNFNKLEFSQAGKTYALIKIRKGQPYLSFCSQQRVSLILI